ncbi:MAG: DUF3108 domain-containing protein [Ignavibacteria bacterium]
MLLLISSRTFSQSEVLFDGEELYYEVNYSFINIGWAKFNTEKVPGKENFFICRAKLKSNNSMPIVDIDYDFISEIELKNNQLITHRFTAYEYKDGKKSTLVCDFNYDSAYINIKKTGSDNNTDIDKKILTSTRFQDGLSIFYFARFNTSKDVSEFVPVMMHTDTSLMKIDFSTKRTDVEISETDYDIASYYLEGVSYFKAVFGLTGDFSGWFSYDEARIPLEAKLQVEIGSIKLELKSWKHGSWQPPRY